jgi:hypothetical protein
LLREGVGVVPAGSSLEQPLGGASRSFDHILEADLPGFVGPLPRELLALLVLVASVELEDFFRR